MYTIKIFALLLVVILAGCVTPGVRPAPEDIDRSRMYNASFDQVWPAIIAVVAESNLPITTLERDSGIIAISDVSYPPEWAYEGTRGSVAGAPDVVTSRVANFNILARPKGPERTRVQVNSSFKMRIRSGNGSNMYPYHYKRVKAYSNGALENKILDGVAHRLK